MRTGTAVTRELAGSRGAGKYVARLMGGRVRQLDGSAAGSDSEESEDEEEDEVIPKLFNFGDYAGTKGKVKGMVKKIHGGVRLKSRFGVWTSEGDEGEADEEEVDYWVSGRRQT